MGNDEDQLNRYMAELFLSDGLWILLLPLGSAGDLGHFLGCSVGCFVAWHSFVCHDPSGLHFPQSVSELV